MVQTLLKITAMPSLPRSAILEDESIFHVTWQCHNQDWLLNEDWSKELYYQLLLKYKDRYGVQIYSYCLMDNHIHLSGRLKDLESFSDFFRVVNSMFARRYNKEVKRRGQVVMDRFKSPRIQTDGDLIKVMQYIDLNPKRAHKVKHPRNNQYSSYAYYAHGAEDPLITPAPSYLELGPTDERRQIAYRTMIEEILQNDWKEKKPYSSVCFIGDPDWTTRKHREIKEVRKAQYEDWSARYQRRFGGII